MPYITNHGGGCCGITHLHDFATPSGRGVAQATHCLNNLLTTEKTNRVVEVVLLDNQVEQWRSWLKEHKFRLVTRFRNSNSGNICNIFHKINRRSRKPKGFY